MVEDLLIEIILTQKWLIITNKRQVTHLIKHENWSSISSNIYNFEKSLQCHKGE